MSHKPLVLFLLATIVALAFACLEIEAPAEDPGGYAPGDSGDLSHSADLASPDETAQPQASDGLSLAPDGHEHGAPFPHVTATLPTGETVVLGEHDLFPSKHLARSPRHQAKFVVWMTGTTP
jgi:hypothetical protein